MMTGDQVPFICRPSWLVKTVVKVDITFAFPPWNLALALAGTILLGLLITLLPIRRATHLRPGDALRYA